MDKKLLGSGSKSSIFYSILRDFGGEACADAMWRLSRIGLFYLSHRGFSIGIEEVTPDSTLVAAKQELIDYGLVFSYQLAIYQHISIYFTRIFNRFAKCDRYILNYEKNTLSCNPGCSMEETLEVRHIKYKN